MFSSLCRAPTPHCANGLASHFAEKQPEEKCLDARTNIHTLTLELALLMVTGNDVPWLRRAALPVPSANPCSSPWEQGSSHLPPFPPTSFILLSLLCYSNEHINLPLSIPSLFIIPLWPQLPIICGLISLLPFLADTVSSPSCDSWLNPRLSGFCSGHETPPGLHHHLHPRVNSLSSS